MLYRRRILRRSDCPTQDSGGAFHPPPFSYS